MRLGEKLRLKKNSLLQKSHPDSPVNLGKVILTIIAYLNKQIESATSIEEIIKIHKEIKAELRGLESVVNTLSSMKEYIEDYKELFCCLRQERYNNSFNYASILLKCYYSSVKSSIYTDSNKRILYKAERELSEARTDLWNMKDKSNYYKKNIFPLIISMQREVTDLLQEIKSGPVEIKKTKPIPVYVSSETTVRMESSTDGRLNPNSGLPNQFTLTSQFTSSTGLASLKRKQTSDGSSSGTALIFKSTITTHGATFENSFSAVTLEANPLVKILLDILSEPDTQTINVRDLANILGIIADFHNKKLKQGSVFNNRIYLVAELYEISFYYHPNDSILKVLKKLKKYYHENFKAYQKDSSYIMKSHLKSLLATDSLYNTFQKLLESYFLEVGKPEFFDKHEPHELVEFIKTKIVKNNLFSQEKLMSIQKLLNETRETLFRVSTSSSTAKVAVATAPVAVSETKTLYLLNNTLLKIFILDSNHREVNEKTAANILQMIADFHYSQLHFVPYDPRLRSRLCPPNYKKRRYTALAHITTELYKNSLDFYYNPTAQNRMEQLHQKLSLSFKANKKFSSHLTAIYPESPSTRAPMSLRDQLEQHLINYIDQLSCVYSIDPYDVNQKLYEVIQFIKKQLRRGKQFTTTELSQIEYLLDQTGDVLLSRPDIVGAPKFTNGMVQ